MIAGLTVVKLRHHWKGAYALNDFRPRARRAFKILRPAFVAMRARKPWRRLRTRFDGWNVRFIAKSPVGSAQLLSHLFQDPAFRA
jgi:hypothetical protein